MKKHVIVMAALLLAVSMPVLAKTAQFSNAGLGSHEVILKPAFTGGTDGEETLSYDGPNNDAIGLTSGGTYAGAAKFTAPSACTLKAVTFYHYQASTSDYVFAWAAGTASEPGAILDSVAYNGADTLWLRLDYTVPIVLNEGDEFWVGARMTHAAGVYPLGIDAGPGDPNGGFLYNAGAWTTLPAVGFDVNWNIKAIISTVSLAHDVGVQSVAPTGRVAPNSTVDFSTVIKNFGSNAETFDVHYEVLDSIGGVNAFEGDTTLTALGVGATATIAIGSLTAEAGDVFITTVSTALPGDENPANDVKVGRAACSIGSNPDGFGYIYEAMQEGDSVTYNWIDPSTGTPISAWQGTGDDGYATITLPFTFRYYDQDLTSLNVCTNGFVETGTGVEYTNAALPNAADANMMCLFWDDLNPSVGGTVYQYNDPGNTYTVIAWVNVPPYSGSGTLTAEMVLDNQGRIRCNYQTLPATVNSATTGIQGLTGASNWFLQYGFNGAPPNHTPAPSTTVLYYYPPYIGVNEGQKPAVAKARLSLPTPYTRNSIEFPGTLGTGTAQVYDLAGNMVKSLGLNGRTARVSLDGLNAGLYFVKLDTGSANEIHKLVLVR